MNAPDDHQNGRREIEVADAGAADAALQQLKPYLQPGKAQEARMVLTRVVSKSHKGPIPSAEELEHLEQVLQGSANRCFEMAEREQSHRHSLENNLVTREFDLRGRGQLLAIFALILLLIVVAFLAYLGDTVSAAALGGATIVGVVAIFVTGKRYDAKESGIAEEESSEPAPPPQKQLTRADRRNQKFNRT